MIMDDLSDDTKKTYAPENLVKISASQLQVGMYVAELDRPWLETPFLTQGFEIRHRSQIAKIGQYCDHVFVLRQGVSRAAHAASKKAAALPKGGRAFAGPRAAATAAVNKGTMVAGVARNKQKVKPLVRNRPVYENTLPVHEAHPVARELRKKGKAAVDKLLDSAQTGQMLDTAAAQEVVSDCVESIVTNVDAMIWMSKIKHQNEYTAEHCLNVCILAIAFGRHLNFDQRELKNLGLCGLLHDVGKMKVPREILDKPGPLTEDERRIMRDHTVEGHKILNETQGMHQYAMDVALHHHETPDGSGYPGGLRAGDLSEYSKIISVVDAYDAMTSDRCYARARSPVEALKILFENRGSQFDEQCALQFMQATGPYPPGTWVELHNGMVGVVLAGRRKFRHLPRVVMVLDANQRHIQRKIIDLHLTDTGELGKDFLIKTTLKDGAYDLHLEDFHLETESPG